MSEPTHAYAAATTTTAASAATAAAVSAASQRARETLALNELKKLLGYRLSAITGSEGTQAAAGAAASSTSAHSGGGNGGGQAVNAANESTTEAYMLRFLRYYDYALPETVAALRRRREFEYTFASFAITPAMVGFLRSGDVAVIGTDHQHRPVLFLNYRSSEAGLLNDVDLQRVTVLLLEYMQSLCIDTAAAAAASRTSNARPHSPSLERGKPSAAAAVHREENNESSASNLYSPASGAMSSSSGGGGNTGAMELGERTRQECVLLVKDEGLVRQAQYPLLNTACELAPLLGKYYPNLLAEVLLVQDELEARHSVGAALAGCSAQVQRAVHLVSLGELTRYVDAETLPQELRGRRPARMMANDFADTVLRHWYTLTAYLQLELQLITTTTTSSNSNSNSNSKEAGMSRRPLYLTAPHVVTASAFLQLQRRSLAALSEGSGAPLMPRPPTPALYDKAMNGTGHAGGNGMTPAAVMMKMPVITSAAAAAAAAAGGRLTAGSSSVIEGSFPSRVFTARSAGDVTTSAASSFRLENGGNTNANALTSNYNNNAMTTTTVDDGICSALSMEDYYDEDEEEAEQHEGGMTTTAAVAGGSSSAMKGTDTTRSASARQQQQHYLQRSASGRAVGWHALGHIRTQANNTTSLAAPLPPTRTILDAAQPTSEEAEHVRNDPTYALTLLQQERARRMMAEQKLQMAEIGIALDPRTSSALERQLASLHQELNVLVAEVVVRARAANAHQAAPTLSQLYDVMLSSLESATGVPAQAQFLTRGDVVDVEVDAAGGCCSCSVM